MDLNNLSHNERIWLNVVIILEESAIKLKHLHDKRANQRARFRRPPHENKFSRYAQKANALATAGDKVPRQELRSGVTCTLFESWILEPNKQLAVPFQAYPGRSGTGEQEVTEQNWQHHKLVKWNDQRYMLTPMVITAPKLQVKTYAAQHKRIQYFQRRHYG